MHLRLLKRDDLPALSDLGTEAFRDDNLQTILFPPEAVANGSLRRSINLRIRKRLVEAGTHCYVSMSDEDDEFWSGTPELLGYAFWTRVGKSEAAKKWQTDTLFSKLERTLIGAEMWYSEYFLDRDRPWDKIHYMRNLSIDHFGSIPEYLELAALAVHPKFHRRGIGGMMLRYGIDLAQKEQVPLVLEASRAGTLLYTKNGFRETGRTEMFPEVIVVAMQLDPKIDCLSIGG
ncbi:GNAT family protein [Botrytis cinerea]